MPFLIGTDEAGYGPNLGPLVITATLWQLDDGIDGAALYKHLRRLVAARLDRATKKRVVWADSKVVYKNGDGLDHLERGVLAALGLIGKLPSEWCQLWHWLDPLCAPRINELPWHLGYSAPVPIWFDGELTELVDTLLTGLAELGVRLIGLLSRAVFPDQFNELTQASNKADALSRVTLSLVADALASLPTGSVKVYCDKHGGRDYYQPLVQTQFADAWVQVLHESSTISSYRFIDGAQQIEIGFHVGGEQYLPVALASMTSKYLREAAMRPFNEFWCSRLPSLKPTAGYPGDSHRFKKAIADLQRELAIDDQILWRSR